MYVNIIVNRYTIDDDDYTTEPVLVSDIDNDGKLIIPMETSPPSVGQLQEGHYAELQLEGYQRPFQRVPEDPVAYASVTKKVITQYITYQT